MNQQTNQPKLQIAELTDHDNPLQKAWDKFFTGVQADKEAAVREALDQEFSNMRNAVIATHPATDMRSWIGAYLNTRLTQLSELTNSQASESDKK